MLVALIAAVLLVRRRRAVVADANAAKQSQLIFGTHEPFMEHNTLRDAAGGGSGSGSTTPGTAFHAYEYATTGPDGYEMPMPNPAYYSAALVPAAGGGYYSVPSLTQAVQGTETGAGAGGYEMPVSEGVYYSTADPRGAVAAKGEPRPYAQLDNPILYSLPGAQTASASANHSYDADHTYEYATSDGPGPVGNGVAKDADYMEAVQGPEEHYHQVTLMPQEPDYLVPMPGQQSQYYQVRSNQPVPPPRTLSFVDMGGRPLRSSSGAGASASASGTAGDGMYEYDVARPLYEYDFGESLAVGPAGKEVGGFGFDGAFSDAVAGADAARDALFQSSQI